MDKQTLRLQFLKAPSDIRDWFVSEEVSSAVQAINKHFTISNDHRSILATLLARLVAKDLSPDYFSGELAIELKIDRDKALGMAAETKRAILDPLKKEFADFGIDITLLDKFQMPIIKTVPLSADAAAGPKIIQDIGTSAASPPPPGMRPQIPLTPRPPAPNPATPANPIPAASFASPNAPSVSMPGLAQAAAAVPTPAQSGLAMPPAEVKPVSTSDVGWVKTRSSGPVVKLDTSGIPPQAPAVVPIQPRPSTSEQANTRSRSSAGAPIGEIERMNMMKKAPTPPVAPVSSAPPAPMILHEDTKFVADEKNAGFTIPKSSINAEIPLPPGKTPNIPRPAVLELGGIPTPRPTAAPHAPVPQGDTSHVVHYTEFKPPLSSVSTASPGPRAVSEITSVAAPKPAATQPPQPNLIPPSPPPPTPPKDSVIVKNFP